MPLTKSPRVITTMAPISATSMPIQRRTPSLSLKKKPAKIAVTIGVRLTNKDVRPAGTRANAPKKQILLINTPVKPKIAVRNICLRFKRGKLPSIFITTITSNIEAIKILPNAAVIIGKD